MRVVAFNASERWAPSDVARDVAKRHAERGTGLDRGLRCFADVRGTGLPPDKVSSPASC